MNPTLSIIVPILNEEGFLQRLLADIEDCRKNLDFPLECLAVDGGSQDRSKEICGEFNVPIIKSRRGRGQQLRAGAEVANGEIFLFLHADCRLTAQHCVTAVQTVQSNGIVAGGFKLEFDHRHPILRFAERVNSIRFRLTKVFYGDHGIFLSRDKYLSAGGFPSQPLFEDVELSKRLRKLGPVVLVSPSLKTSARRFTRGGIVRTYLLMAWLHVLYWTRVSPQRLARMYSRS